MSRAQAQAGLAVPKSRLKTKHDWAFAVRTPQLWNSLSEDLVLQNIYYYFKKFFFFQKKLFISSSTLLYFQQVLSVFIIVMISKQIDGHSSEMDNFCHPSRICPVLKRSGETFEAKCTTFVLDLL